MIPEQFYVILHREPHKLDLMYGPEDEMRALERVYALVDLHTCRWTRDHDQLHVWAAEWYKPKEAS